LRGKSGYEIAGNWPRDALKAIDAPYGSHRRHEIFDAVNESVDRLAKTNDRWPPCVAPTAKMDRNTEAPSDERLGVTPMPSKEVHLHHREAMFKPRSCSMAV
jgi:hypothetical protein